MDLLEFYCQQRNALEIISDEQAAFLLAFINKLETTSINSLSNHLGWSQSEVEAVLQRLSAAGFISITHFRETESVHILITLIGKDTLRLFGLLDPPQHQEPIVPEIAENNIPPRQLVTPSSVRWLHISDKAKTIVPKGFVTRKRKLGLYVRERMSKPKSWFEFRFFVRTYWELLSTYILLVSASTATILDEVARDLKASQGIEPQWNLQVYNNPRSLVINLESKAKEEVERILLFLDSDKLDEELENLWLLRAAAAEHGQKLNINRGAEVWAENEWAANLGVQKKPKVGADDTIMLIEENADKTIDRFALNHLEIVMSFPRSILPSRTQALITASLNPMHRSSGLIYAPPDEMLGIASPILKNYFKTSQQDVHGKVCHVIAIPNRHRERRDGTNLAEFLRVCADPRMSVNLMLDIETAEEWIQQFEYPTSHDDLQIC